MDFFRLQMGKLSLHLPDAMNWDRSKVLGPLE